MTEKKILVYVSGPYTYPDPEKNLTRALYYAEKLVKLGLVPLIPHLNIEWERYAEHVYDFWLDIDIQYMLRCDAVFRFDGESRGADIETRVAMKNNIPVFFNLQTLERKLVLKLEDLE